MSSPDLCRCFDEPARELQTVRYLGMDEYYAEATVLSCPRCGQHWLHYLFENEAFAHSGRWYLGSLTDTVEATVTAGNARKILGQLPWYFYGGSYYGGKTGKASGAIFL